MSYIINGSCSTCHYCFRTCPVDAIRFVGLEYAIDEEKCIDCGACEKICPAGIIAKKGEDVTVDPHEMEHLSCDLVILGGGGSGLIAAASYAKLTGRKVIVLEKSRKTGGNTTLGHGFITRYSNKHKEADMPDLREEAIKSILASKTGRGLSPSLVRKTLYAQTDFLDWLFELGGLDEHMTLVDMRPRGSQMGPFPFLPGFLDFPNRTQNVKSTDHSMGPGWMGTYVVEKMKSECEKLGVEILTQHAAKEIVVDNNDTFTKVVCDNPGGEVTVEARACVIATGGFSRNKEVMSKLRPTFYEGAPVHTFTVASNTGDAITMAEKIGAKFDFEHVKIPLFGPVHHPFSFPVMALVESPRSIMVNLDGKRFRAEDLPPAMDFLGPLEEQPNHLAYTIFDSRIMEKMGEEALARNSHDPSRQECVSHWREELEYETTLDTPVKKADTIEELADRAGIDAAALVETVKKYNQYCETGKDIDLNKKAEFLDKIEVPPFYAVYQQRFNEGAEGGIVNDDELRVIKEDGTPFNGLYIVGDPCRGVIKTDDEGGKIGEMPWAVASGYMVADNIADHLGDNLKVESGTLI